MKHGSEGSLSGGPVFRRSGLLQFVLSLVAAGLFVAVLPGVAPAAEPEGAGFLTEQGPPPPGANDPTCQPDADKQTPVVLVHGTFEDMAQNWAVLSPTLRSAGYCVYALNYGDRGTGPIEDSAEELDEFVDGVLALTGSEKVSIVGHSQGGMMPRHWIKFLGGDSKVEDLIGLAPSNNGTKGNASRLDAEPSDWGVEGTLAEDSSACVACEQQQAGSEFLKELNRGNETPGLISYTVIATRYDEVIVPFTLSFLDGKPERLTSNITLQEVNPANPAIHQTIYNDPDTFKLIFDALERPGPADPGESSLLQRASPG